MPRRLPSITALRAFEAAARCESFKQAAEELGVTPTAVSHQVKNLEGSFGQPLFHRRTRHVRLTDSGALLYDGLREAFDRMEQAVLRCRNAPARETVTLGLGPIVAAKWLSPRLSRFWARCPEVDLRLHHSPVTLAFGATAADLAIAWGDGQWPGLSVEPLLEIQVTPVLSPRLRQTAGGLAKPADLLRLPLLHQRDDSAWREWLEAAGLTLPDRVPGTVIEDAHVVLQAAIEGQGVALGTLPLVADDLTADGCYDPSPSRSRPAAPIT